MPDLINRFEERRLCLPVEEMVTAVNAAGVDALASDSAGTFVCNDTMYLVLHHLLGTGVPAGFIHVPASGPLPCDRIAAGIVAAIGVLG